MYLNTSSSHLHFYLFNLGQWPCLQAPWFIIVIQGRSTWFNSSSVLDKIYEPLVILSLRSYAQVSYEHLVRSLHIITFIMSSASLWLDLFFIMSTTSKGRSCSWKWVWRQFSFRLFLTCVVTPDSLPGMVAALS